ncbi:MAG: DUF494 domain-containing protein [Gammaproteobacteria bacterium]|nr:DUF494 domain-containing protein [Gammaproteobacteria bacterium]
MKENVIDVLMYIFSSYVDSEDILPEDRAGIDADLQEAGFENDSIDRAFEWLDGLALNDNNNEQKQSDKAFRVFAAAELKNLDKKAQNLLVYLENAGVLTPELRELAINRILALGGDGDIDIDDIKWVIMMVLFNNEEDESSLWHYEDMVFDDQPAYFH